MEHGAWGMKCAAFGMVLVFLFHVHANVCTAHPLEEAAVYDISKEDAARQFKENAIQKCSSHEVRNAPINQILVADRWIAIGTKEKHVLVLDLEGSPKYSFRFSTSGGYLLYFDKSIDGLVLYIPRSSIYYTFNDAGDIIRVEGYTNRGKPYEDSRERKYDSEGNRYSLATSGGIGNKVFRQYSKIQKEDRNHKKCMFYDNGEVSILRYHWYRFGAVLLILSMLFYFFIIKRRAGGTGKRKISCPENRGIV